MQEFIGVKLFYAFVLGCGECRENVGNIEGLVRSIKKLMCSLNESLLHLLTKAIINTIIEYKAICKIIKHKINEG